MTTKSSLLPTQKICFVLSLVIVISMRWNDETRFQIHSPNSFGSVFVSSFRSTSVTLSKQQQQQHHKIPNQIASKDFNRWGYNHHHHGQYGTSSTRSMSRYAHRDPLIMMPSQTPMVPYKVCTHIYISIYLYDSFSSFLQRLFYRYLDIFFWNPHISPPAFRSLSHF